MKVSAQLLSSSLSGCIRKFVCFALKVQVSGDQWSLTVGKFDLIPRPSRFGLVLPFVCLTSNPTMFRKGQIGNSTKPNDLATALADPINYVLCKWTRGIVSFILTHLLPYLCMYSVSMIYEFISRWGFTSKTKKSFPTNTVNSFTASENLII